MSFMFCTVNGCDCQLIIKENYDDDDDDDGICNDHSVAIFLLSLAVKEF